MRLFESKRRFIAGLLVFLMLTSVASAKDPQAGRESMFILGAGVRALGMGGAYSAFADDASGAYWNPAGLSLLEYRELSAMHVSLYEDTRYDFGALAWPVLDVGTIGLGGIILGTSDIQYRDVHGPTEKHDYSTGQYWASFGTRIFRSLHGGVNFKLLNESLGDFSATTASIDFGMLMRLHRFLSIGVNAQDIIAGGLKLASYEEDIPYNIKGGIGIQYTNKLNTFGFRAAGDVDKTEGQPAIAHFGGEVSIQSRYFARAGYDREEMTFGGGVKYGKFALDYAYKANDVLGASHRIGLSLFFGPTISEQRTARFERERREEIERQESEKQAKIDGFWKQASDAYDRGDLDSAVVLCSQVLAYDPDHIEAAEMLDNARNRAGQELRDTYQDRGRQEAIDAVIERRIANGRQLLSEDRLNEAKVEFGEVLKVSPDHPDALDGLVQVEIRTEQKASQFNINGDRLFDSREYGEAIVMWNRAIEVKPQLPGVQRKIAEAKRLMLIDQRLRDALQALGEEDHESARSLFNSVLEVDSTNSIAIEYLDNLDRQDSPVVTLDELKNDSEHWQYYLDGLSLFREKKYQQAIDVWQKVVSKYPGCEAARANIDQARLRLGR